MCMSVCDDHTVSVYINIVIHQVNTMAILLYTDTEKATASWYDIVKSQIDNMKVELR